MNFNVAITKSYSFSVDYGINELGVRGSTYPLQSPLANQPRQAYAPCTSLPGPSPTLQTLNQVSYILHGFFSIELLNE